jgi:hypothetical protein
VTSLRWSVRLLYSGWVALHHVRCNFSNELSTSA